MTHEEAFLADILAHPGDDFPRLAFADWLDEAGDAPGAAFQRWVAAERVAPDVSDSGKTFYWWRADPQVT